MNILPQNPRQTTSAVSAWLRKARAGLINNTPIQSGDMLITQTSYGVKYSIKKQNWVYARYCGTFEKLKSYNIGDMVCVNKEEEYTIAGIKYYQKKGTYLCVYPVPVMVTITGQFDIDTPTYLLNYLTTINKRSPVVCYAPIIPMPEKSAFEVLGNIQGRYWQILGLEPLEFNMCEDGTTKTYYVQAAESGSITP